MKMIAILTYPDGFTKQIELSGNMRLCTLEKIQDVYKNLNLQLDIIGYIWG